MSDARSPAPDEVRLPLMDETALIAKQSIETGRVRVRTEIDEREEVLRDLLMREDVRVERIPIDRQIDEIPAPRQEGDVTIIPIVDEVAVVEKRLVLREELRIVRVRSVEPVEQRVKLRSTRAVVEREEPAQINRRPPIQPEE